MTAAVTWGIAYNLQSNVSATSAIQAFLFLVARAYTYNSDECI